MKAELRDRLGMIRKSFDKQIKDREAATNKTVSCILPVPQIFLYVSSRLSIVSPSILRMTSNQTRTSPLWKWKVTLRSGNELYGQVYTLTSSF